MAFLKMQPFADLDTWQKVKTRLDEKFKRPIIYEIVQEKISGLRQNREENLEVYGNKIQIALHKLNRASESLTEDGGEVALLMKANEKVAIRAFEKGLYNANLRICITAKDFNSLVSAITYAMSKENLYRNESRIRCNYCNIIGHAEEDCRRKQNRKGHNYNDDCFRRPNSPNDGDSDLDSDSKDSHNGNSSNRWQDNDPGNGRNDDNKDYYLDSGGMGEISSKETEN